MSEIDFETGDPIWQATIEHRNPGASPVWMRAFNAPDRDEALRKAVNLFIDDGLVEILISKIWLSELKPIEEDMITFFEGGDQDGGRKDSGVAEGERSQTE